MAAAHHASETPHFACSSCHLEHRGRDAALVRVADAACTTCHADLPGHSLAKTSVGRATRFDPDNHPRFDFQRADPGRLKFSHRRHLVEGLSFGPGNRADVWTLDKIPQGLREQYRQFAGADGVVKLDCSACHQFSAVDAPAVAATADAPPRSSGAYMRPVNYEAHCQACHPLNFEPAQAATYEPGSPDVVPHGLSARQVRTFIERAAAAEALRENSSLLDKPASRARELPNKPEGENQATLRQLLAERANGSLLHVQKVCSKCHFLAGDQAGQATIEIEPTRVPARWFEHARFDHFAHRAVDCQQCHVLPARPVEGSALDHAAVLIPGLETCARCHSPGRIEQGVALGGARFDCVECHFYHGREGATVASHAQVGAREPAHRAEQRKLSLDEFLSGGGSP
jgi:hypothetical protein